MHIDKELVEFAFMVSSMLLEIPNISSSSRNLKKNVISRSLRMLVQANEIQIFNGPPETTRDTIAYAFTRLYESQWEEALEYLMSNNKLWNDMPDSQTVKDIYTQKIKEVAFIAFMYRNSRYYDSFDLSELSQKFYLANIKQIATRLIVQEQYPASLSGKDQNSLVFHHLKGEADKDYAFSYLDTCKQLMTKNTKMVTQIESKRSKQ